MRNQFFEFICKGGDYPAERNEEIMAMINDCLSSSRFWFFFNENNECRKSYSCISFLCDELYNVINAQGLHHDLLQRIRDGWFEEWQETFLEEFNENVKDELWMQLQEHENV